MSKHNGDSDSDTSYSMITDSMRHLMPQESYVITTADHS